MSGGFTFRGIDISELGLTYAPLLSNLYVFNSEDKISEQSFDSHKGGYFYGSTVQAKTFTLRCFFEDSNVNDGIIDKINRLFYVGSTGRLIFEKRPWMYYIATVTDLSLQQFTNRLNGLITISLKAYYPYARCSYKSVPDLVYRYIKGETLSSAEMTLLKRFDCTTGNILDLTTASNTDLFDPIEAIDNMKLNAQFFNSSMTPSISLASDSTPITELTSFLIYNPGSLTADVALLVGGNVGQGITIVNETTNQECGVVLLTESNSAAGTTAGARIDYIIMDSLNGKVVSVDDTVSKTKSLAFLYHNKGFINLASSQGEFSKDLSVGIINGKNVVYCKNGFSDLDIGKYIYINSKWYKIEKIALYQNGSQIDEDDDFALLSLAKADYAILDSNISTNILTDQDSTTTHDLETSAYTSGTIAIDLSYSYATASVYIDYKQKALLDKAEISDDSPLLALNVTVKLLARHQSGSKWITDASVSSKSGDSDGYVECTLFIPLQSTHLYLTISQNDCAQYRLLKLEYGQNKTSSDSVWTYVNTPIVRMNKITIKPSDTDMSLNHLVINYKPTFK